MWPIMFMRFNSKSISLNILILRNTLAQWQCFYFFPSFSGPYINTVQQQGKSALIIIFVLPMDNIQMYTVYIWRDKKKKTPTHYAFSQRLINVCMCTTERDLFYQSPLNCTTPSYVRGGGLAMITIIIYVIFMLLYTSPQTVFLCSWVFQY